MSVVLQFPASRVRRHRRASIDSRAASRDIKSVVTLAAFAISVAQIANHHSGGMESRCHHLLTCQAVAPTSDAMASLDAHSSMIERNERIDIGERLGQIVLIGKRVLSCDCENGHGHNVLMAKQLTAREKRMQFAQLVKRARERRGLSQVQVATALGIKQDRYKHYEVDRYLPHDLIEPFCIICDIESDYFYPQARRVRPAVA